MKKKIFISVVILSLALVGGYWVQDRRVDPALKDLPAITQQIIQSKEAPQKDGIAKIRKASASSDKHQGWGAKVYQLAMVETKPEERIRLLRIAKEHLLFAKELGK